MEIKIFFTVLATVAALMAFYPYLRDVFKRNTEPHVFTWLIWSITQGTATAALWIGGGGLGAISLTIGEALVFTIFILSLRGGKKHITKSDTVALASALLAIGFWWFLHNPLLAVLSVVVIDLIGYFPTFRKSYLHPWRETVFSWGLFAAGDIFAILALESYNYLTLSYLATIFIANLSLVVFLLLRRRNIKKPLAGEILTNKVK